MAEEAHDAEKARARLLQLFDEDEWQFSERARTEGKIALRWLHDREPRDGEMVDYVVSLLQGGMPLRCAAQGDPPGSTGIAWQMSDSRNIFVKLQIRERRMGHEEAYIQSLHESVHSR